MRYLLMIYVDPAVWESLSERERDAVFRAHDEFRRPIADSGELIGHAALADPSNSTTVRVRDGAPIMTAGPYQAAREHLAGYYIVDCESAERAGALAGQLPDARYAAIEVRPVMDASGMEM